MIVLDASAAVEMLLRLPAGATVADRLNAAGSIHAPHLLDTEVTHVVRRMLQAGQIDAMRAELAISCLNDLPLTRHAHRPLTARVWSLRSNFSAYDATYVALAEALGATLLTRDARLARATPLGVQVITIGAAPPLDTP